MQPSAQHQRASSRATAQLATTALLPASSSAFLRSASLRDPLAACLLTAGATSWPLLRGLGSREAFT